MNIEVFSLLQNSEFVIQYSIFVFKILYLHGCDESRPYGHGPPTQARFLWIRAVFIITLKNISQHTL